MAEPADRTQYSGGIYQGGGDSGCPSEVTGHASMRLGPQHLRRVWGLQGRPAKPGSEVMRVERVEAGEGRDQTVKSFWGPLLGFKEILQQLETKGLQQEDHRSLPLTAGWKILTTSWCIWSRCHRVATEHRPLCSLPPEDPLVLIAVNW